MQYPSIARGRHGSSRCLRAEDVGGSCLFFEEEAQVIAIFLEEALRGRDAHGAAHARDPTEELLALAHLYPRPYLLPVAWVQRIAHYAGEKQSNPDNSASGSIKLAKERIELMKQYDIMD